MHFVKRNSIINNIYLVDSVVGLSHVSSAQMFPGQTKLPSVLVGPVESRHVALLQSVLQPLLQCMHRSTHGNNCTHSTHPSTALYTETPTSFIVFGATVCKTVRPMLSDRRPVLSCLSVRNVSVLWPNGWMDQDETWHGGRPRPRPHIVLDGDPVPPNVMAALPNIGGALCLTPQSLADAHY